MGAHWVGIKMKKNLVLEQIVAKSNFLLQLPGDSFSLSFILFSFFPQMAFQPPLKVKIRSRCRCPSRTSLIAVGFVFSSQFDTLNENVPWDFTIKHIAWVLTKIFSVDCILVFFPPDFVQHCLECPETSIQALHLKCQHCCLMWGISGPLYIRSRQCWCKFLLKCWC